MNKLNRTIVERWFIPIDSLMISSAILIIILSSIFVFVILFEKSCHTVAMLLTGNSCVSAFIWGSCLLGSSLSILKKDLQKIAYEDPLCIY